MRGCESAASQETCLDSCRERCVGNDLPSRTFFARKSGRHQPRPLQACAGLAFFMVIYGIHSALATREGQGRTCPEHRGPRRGRPSPPRAPSTTAGTKGRGKGETPGGGVPGKPAQVPPCPSAEFQRTRTLLIGLVAATVSVLLSAAAAGRVVKDQTGRNVNVPDNPHRLVSLAPSITETVYALGLGDELVGDTDYCDFPPQAKNKPHVGTMVNPSLERIVGLKPDLALGTPEANRRETADQLERLGIPVYGVSASTLAGTLASIEDLGQILGRAAAARSLVAKLQARIDLVKKRVAGQAQPKVLFVVWYRPLITVGPTTFIADGIRAAGGIPIGNSLKGEWPRLSLEELVAQNPEVILLPKAESFSPSLEEFRSLPGWKELGAVKKGRMYFVSETIMRPSPRLIDALEELVRILHPEVAAQNGVVQ